MSGNSESSACLCLISYGEERQMLAARFWDHDKPLTGAMNPGVPINPAQALEGRTCCRRPIVFLPRLKSDTQQSEMNDSGSRAIVLICILKTARHQSTCSAQPIGHRA